jgi:hypothetical protein
MKRTLALILLVVIAFSSVVGAPAKKKKKGPCRPTLAKCCVASIPAINFVDHHLWGSDVYVIPEYSFGVEVKDQEIHLSGEHSQRAWLDYETASNRLKWDSNKTALWELHSRLSAEHAEQALAAESP